MGVRGYILNEEEIKKIQNKENIKTFKSYIASQRTHTIALCFKVLQK